MHQILTLMSQFSGAGFCIEQIKGTTLQPVVAIGFGIAPAPYQLPLDASLSGQCLQLMNPACSNDYPVRARIDRQHCRMGVCDMLLCLPLRREGLAWGVLKVLQMANGPETPTERWQVLARFLENTLTQEALGTCNTQAEGRMQVILENARDAVVSTNRQGVIQIWNRAAEQLFDIPAADAIGQPIHHFDGMSAIFLPESAIENKLSRNLEQLANTDTLTGLANRHEVSRRLSQLIRQAEAGGPLFALYFLDLNGFKQFNDQFGHDAGDKALQSFARRLKSGLRHQDMAGRWGGDEFVVLAEGVALPEQALSLASKIAVSIDTPHDSVEPVLSASIGITLFAQGQSADSLLKQADIAMYRAKRQRETGSRLALYKAEPPSGAP